MNRAILLVICDFLLLSILALVRWEDPDTQRQEPEKEVVQQPVDNPASEDLVELLRLSLENEEMARQELARELEARAQALSAQEQRASQLLQSNEELAAEQERLRQMREQLEREREALASQVQDTSQRLTQTAEERSQLRETLAAAQERQRLLQEQLQQREKALEQMQMTAKQIEEANAQLEQERAVLSTRLESASVAQQRLESQLQTLQVEKEAVQAQAERLSQNVGELAQATQTVRQEITQEIRQATPLSMNAIYDRFRQNRVPASFVSTEPQLIGTRNVNYRTNTIFIEGPDGEIYALFEASETPFREPNLDDLRSVSGQMQVGQQALQILSVSFLQADPRLVMVRVSKQYATQAGLQPFKLSGDPLRFPEAVVITASGDKYGEASFRLTPTSVNYLEMQTRPVSRLFGEFSPSRGDLVFSKSGDLIGFMVDNSRAAVVNSTATVASLALGDSFSRTEAEAVQRTVRMFLPTTATTP